MEPRCPYDPVIQCGLHRRGLAEARPSPLFRQCGGTAGEALPTGRVIRTAMRTRKAGIVGPLDRTGSGSGMRCHPLADGRQTDCHVSPLACGIKDQLVLVT